MWSPPEGRYSEIARAMVATGDYITPRLNGVKYLKKPPLFFWLESLSLRIFGLSEWSLRSWNALFALLGCLTVYVAGRKFFDRTTGLMSAAILASSPLYYAMGRIIMPDMAVTFFVTVALIAFLVGVHEAPGWRRRVALCAFYVFAALATLTKGFIGMVIPGLIIGIWLLLIRSRPTLNRMWIPAGVALFLLIAAPWHVLAAHANRDFFRIYWVQEHFGRYLSEHAPFYQAWSLIPVLLLGAFPWTAFLPQALSHGLKASPEPNRRVMIFFALWAGLVFLFFSASSSKQIPYILPMFPPLAIVLGSYFATAWQRRRLSGISMGFWILVIAVLLWVIAEPGIPQHYLERYSNWPNLELPVSEATIASADGQSYSDLAHFSVHVRYQTAILVTGIVAAFLSGRKSLRAAFLSLLTSSILFLALLDSSLPLLDQRRSVKALAMALKPRLEPWTEVASYHAYYQDLPVYLERRVTVVSWDGDQLDPMGEDVTRWIIDDATFWRRWRGPAAMYMLTTRRIYEELRLGAGREFFLIDETDYNVLLGNGRARLERAPSGTSASSRSRAEPSIP